MGGLLDTISARLFPGNAQDGLISDEDIALARKQGLLQLGAGLLASSGPSTQRVGFGQAVGSALAGAQQGFQGSLDSMIERKQKAAAAGQLQLKTAQALKTQAALAELEKTRPTTSDPEALRAWLIQAIPVIASTSPELAGQYSNVLNALKSKESAQTVRNISGAALGLDPKKTYSVQVDDAGKPVGKPLEEGVPPGTQAGFDFREHMTPVQQMRGENAIVTSFSRDAKDYAKAHEAWSQVEGVVKRVQAGAHSPDDVVQLIDGISRLNNPGAVVRTSTVQLQLDKIGSLVQKAQMKYGQAANGMWPKDVVEGIARAAHAIADEHAKQYYSLRNKAKARMAKIGLSDDYSDSVLPDTWNGHEDGPAFGVPAVPQRLPGETVQQYIQRTQGGQQ